MRKFSSEPESRTQATCGEVFFLLQDACCGGPTHFCGKSQQTDILLFGRLTPHHTYLTFGPRNMSRPRATCVGEPPCSAHKTMVFHAPRGTWHGTGSGVRPRRVSGFHQIRWTQRQRWNSAILGDDPPRCAGQGRGARCRRCRKM